MASKADVALKNAGKSCNLCALNTSEDSLHEAWSEVRSKLPPPCYHGSFAFCRVPHIADHVHAPNTIPNLCAGYSLYSTARHVP